LRGLIFACRALLGKMRHTRSRQPRRMARRPIHYIAASLAGQADRGFAPAERPSRPRKPPDVWALQDGGSGVARFVEDKVFAAAKPKFFNAVRQTLFKRNKACVASRASFEAPKTLMARGARASANPKNRLWLKRAASKFSWPFGVIAHVRTSAPIFKKIFAPTYTG
jgi:hypothetical protein